MNGETLPVIHTDRELARLMEDMKATDVSLRPRAQEVQQRLSHICDKPRRRRQRFLLTLTLVSLVVGLAASLLGYRHALAQQRQALIARDQSDEFAQFLIALFEEADPYAASRMGRSVRDVLDVASEEIATQLTRQPATRARMMSVLGHVNRMNDENEKALQLLTEAVRMQREIEDKGLSISLVRLAMVEHKRGQIERAWALINEAEAMMHQNDSSQLHLAELWVGKGKVAEARGDHEVAKSCFERVVDQARKLDQREALADALFNLGRSQSNLKEYDAGASNIQESLALTREIYGDAHPQVALVLNNFGYLRYQQGRFADAERLFLETYELRKRIMPTGDSSIVRALFNLGGVRMVTEQWSEAAEIYQDCLRVLDEDPEKDPKTIPAALNKLALCYLFLNRVHDADGLLQRARLMLEQQVQAPDLEPSVMINAAWCDALLGRPDVGKLRLLEWLSQASVQNPDHSDLARCHGVWDCASSNHRTVFRPRRTLPKASIFLVPAQTPWRNRCVLGQRCALENAVSDRILTVPVDLKGLRAQTAFTFS